MPCKYTIERNGELVLERWHGVVSPDEILGQKDVLLREDGISEGATVLSDCRDAEFVISQEAVELFAKAEGNVAGETRIKRYGFLVRDDVYNQAQFFSEKVKQFGVTSIVFNSFEVASKWVGLSAEELDGLMSRLDGRTAS
ncbi:MAG: hypothetical protein R3178_06780 [Rhodothermales bacterium]|nr:hypothetical protein [Rhodothermales bacterium]